MNHPERRHWAPLSVALVAILFLVSGCAGPLLLVEHEGNGAWSTLSNSFAGGDPRYPDEGTRPYWNGLLLQLGEYPMENGSPLVRWDGVVLVRGSGEEIRLAKGGFSWINVVSRKADGGEPLGEDDALHLYPSNAYTMCNEDLDDGCLRNRKLHYKLDTKAVITYWQGPSGFGAAVLPRAQEGTDRHFNSHRFKLGDPVTVTVYKEQLQNGAWHLVKIRGPYKDIKEIRVAVDASGPQGGGKDDPEWPVHGGGGG